MLSVIFGQFLELRIVFMTPVEKIAPFLFGSEVLKLPDDFNLGAARLNQVLFHCEVHEELQSSFRVDLLQFGQMGVYYTVHHFQNYLLNIFHHFGQCPTEDVEFD